MMKNEPIEKFKHNNRTVCIYVDDDPIHPRKDQDTLCTIAHWHSRYDFGRQMAHALNEEDMRAHLDDMGEEVLAILPLYLFDHSGIKLSNSPFGVRFDSGQVGWIYVTSKSAAEMGCIAAGWDRARYEEAIRAETETYSHFVANEVYGFRVFGKDGDELADGWGYFGDTKECISEAKKSAEKSEDPAVTADAEEMAARPTYAGVSVG